MAVLAARCAKARPSSSKDLNIRSERNSFHNTMRFAPHQPRISTCQFTFSQGLAIGADAPWWFGYGWAPSKEDGR